MNVEDMTMQVVLCEGCVIGHCAVVDTSGAIIYCGPIKRAVVSDKSSVYMNPLDFEKFEAHRLKRSKK